MAPGSEAAPGPQAPISQEAPQDQSLSGKVGRSLSRLAKALAPNRAPDILDELEPGTELERGGERVLLVHAGTDEVTVAARRKGSWAKETLSRSKARRALPAGKADAQTLAAAAAQAQVSWESAARKKADRDAYKAFLAADHWAKIKEDFGEELARVRGLKDKAAVTAYVRAEADKVLERIKGVHGSANIGFHYNLHGGQREQYVEGGGIRATMGDIALQYTMNGDRNYKVYFFQSANHSLYDVLNERNPQPMISRMGSVLMLFRRDSEYLKNAEATGAAARAGDISLDFDTSKAWGIPYDTFLAPPLDVFNGVARKTGQKRLSRDEETLAVVRYIETAVAGPRAKETPEVHPLLSGRSTELELQGLGYKGSRLYDGGAKAARLGSGEFGIVDEHPRIPGAVIKAVAPSAEIQIFSDFKPERTWLLEEASARRLAEIGAGPRFFGKAQIGGALVSVRERIFGDTLERLIMDRRYGPEEHALMLDLVQKLAAAGFVGDDMRPSNIMIGRTAADGARRAFIIDGTGQIPLAGGSPEERLGNAWTHQVDLKWQMNPLVGEIRHSKALGEILDEGLSRSRDKTWWQRFKRVLKEMASAPMTPPFSKM